MFTIILTILIIIFLLINFKVYKNIINYLNIFLIMYYLIMLLSNSGIYGFSIPSEKTNAYLLIALISLEFFSLLFMKIKLNVEETNKKEILNRKRLLFISIVVTILMIPTTIEGIKILSEQGFTAVRSAAFSDDIYSSYTKIFLAYILVPLIIYFNFIFYFTISSYITVCYHYTMTKDNNENRIYFHCNKSHLTRHFGSVTLNLSLECSKNSPAKFCHH